MHTLVGRYVIAEQWKVHCAVGEPSFGEMQSCDASQKTMSRISIKKMNCWQLHAPDNQRTSMPPADHPRRPSTLAATRPSSAPVGSHSEAGSPQTGNPPSRRRCRDRRIDLASGVSRLRLRRRRCWEERDDADRRA